MLRRNGPVVKSVKSVLRLEGSLCICIWHVYRQEILEIPCPIFHWQVCKEYIDILDNIFWESIFYLLVWSPPPHIPYISSPNQCLLFAAHAHTIATYFAVVSILYHLFLVFLSTPYLELLSFTLTLHIHLTILISARWSATSFLSRCAMLARSWES